MFSKDKIEYFKQKLEEEKNRLENDLSKIAKKNPDVPGDWISGSEDLNTGIADPADIADSFEEMENRGAIEDALEYRLFKVNEALERIKKGAYGICGKCEKQIEEGRLEAFPSARHCVNHGQN